MRQPDFNTSVFGTHGKDRGLFWLGGKLASWIEQDTNKKRFDRTTRAALGRRVLFLFLTHNHPSGVGTRRALGMGMDPTGTDEMGVPMALHPLIMNSRECQDWEGTQVMLLAGGNVDIQDPSGGTALGLAAMQGVSKLPLIQWLLENGANPLHVDKSGRTPLFRALDGRRPFLSFGDPVEDVRVLECLLQAAGEKCLEQRDRQERNILDLARDRRDLGAEECIEAWRQRWTSEKMRARLSEIVARPLEVENATRRM